jgi:hypothetical protein
MAKDPQIEKVTDGSRVPDPPPHVPHPTPTPRTDLSSGFGGEHIDSIEDALQCVRDVGMAFAAGDYPEALIHVGHLTTAAGELAKRVVNRPGPRGSAGREPLNATFAGKLMALEQECRRLEMEAHPGRLRAAGASQTLAIDWTKIAQLIQLIVSIIADIRGNVVTP